MDLIAEESVGTRGKILIVDDMLMHLEAATLYLEASGFSVFCASNVHTAWTMITQEEPDLVLLDVVMPGGNGLDLLSNLQSRYPGITVVIMTAFGSEDIAASALKLGAVDYIRKPFMYSNLSRVVEKILGKKRELRKKERALETAYEELQVSSESILQCISAGVVAVDKNLSIRMLNQKARQLLGVGDANVIGLQFAEALPLLGGLDLLPDTIKSETGYRFREVEIPGPNGPVVLNVNTDVVFNRHSNIIGAVAVFDDITELRQIHETLMEREKLAIIGQMAAGIVHEIRNPLTAIRGFAQMISGKVTDPGLQDYLSIIISESNRMNQVVENFLQLARPKLPNYTRISINEVLEEMVPLIESQAFLQNVDVGIETDGAVPASLMDPNQMKQIILNLFQNALEAMENGGTLGFRTVYIRECNEIRLDVRDTGTGIPAEKLKELGVPFYTTKPNGTGLGLSICFSIVDQHKGRIEVQSEEGQGTTFSVFLPVETQSIN